MKTREKDQPTLQLQTLSTEQMRGIAGGFYSLNLGTFQFPDRTVGGCGTTVLMDRMVSILR